MRKAFLEAGRIRNVHGLRGEVKAENWLESDSLFASLKHFFLQPDGGRECRVAGRRRQGELFLLSFEGIPDVDAARPLKGRTLYAKREEIDPSGEKVFFAELIGTPLFEESTGKIYGKILDVTDRGSGDLYVVGLPDGREAYFPAVRAFVRSCDPEKGVGVEAPEGIFDP